MPDAVAKGTHWQGLPLHPFEIALRLGLADGAFVEGRNLKIERRCFGGLGQTEVGALGRDLASYPMDAFIGWTTQAMML